MTLKTKASKKSAPKKKSAPEKSAPDLHALVRRAIEDWPVARAQAFEAKRGGACELACPGFVLLALVHGGPELGLPQGRALAVFQARQWRQSPDAPVPVQREGATPPKGAQYVVWDVEAKRHPEVVIDEKVDLFDPSAPLSFLAVKRGKSFIDFDFEDMAEECMDHVEPRDFKRVEREVLFEVLSERVPGAGDASNRALVKKLHTSSRVGGTPVHNARDHIQWARKIKASDFRYAIHLGADIFDCFFGDAGSLHVWLSKDGKHVYLDGDSA